MNAVESEQCTKARLLEAAIELFAEKGFSGAASRDICSRAGANIAAVNYYFGSKEKLYAEAWRKAFHDSMAAHPRDGGVPRDAPPEERLRGRIRALIESVMDEKNMSFLIVHKEMSSPTALLRSVTKECINPLRVETLELVRELLGPRASEKQLRFCMASIMSQCLDVPIRYRIRRHHEGDGKPRWLADDVDGYIDHVTNFCIAGIRAVRQRAPDSEKHE